MLEIAEKIYQPDSSVNIITATFSILLVLLDLSAVLVTTIDTCTYVCSLSELIM